MDELVRQHIQTTDLKSISTLLNAVKQRSAAAGSGGGGGGSATASAATDSKSAAEIASEFDGLLRSLQLYRSQLTADVARHTAANQTVRWIDRARSLHLIIS